MKEKAIKKLKDEMNKNKDNLGIQAIGKFLISYIEKNPEASEKILDNSKTITNGFEEIRKEAFKKKTKNYAFISDQEGFQIVLKYFGIENKPKAKITNATSNAQIKKSTSFDVTLDDLLK